MVSTFLSTLMVAVMAPPNNASVLYFSASYCQPCVQMQPVFAQLEREGVEVYQIDIQQRPDLVQQFQVENLPTIVFRSGEREVDRMVGAASYEQVRRRYDRTAARTAGAPSAPVQPMVASQAAQQSVVIRGQSPGVPAMPKMAGLLAGQRAVAEQVAEQASQISTLSAAPRLTLPQAIQRAERATVRIRVDEANTTAHGTGTIVDVHGNEALVLTCGHLFRDMTPGSVVSVDLFAGTPNEINLPSQLIDFKADETDIGLISFRLPVAVEPVELLPRGEAIQAGQGAFSFGCDHGQTPSRRDTKITSVNRYNGPANVEIAGAPAVGRSGGGLFDEQGRLIGVCNAADSNGDRGIYAGADVVYAQVERLGLSHLFEAAPVQPSPTARAVDATLVAAGTSQNPRAPAPASAVNSPGPSTAGTKVTCIVQGADGQQQMLTINQPTPELLQALQSQASQ